MIRSYYQLMKNTQQGAVIGLILETRQPKKDGTCPVKIRATFDRKQRYYNAGMDLTPDDWEKVMSINPRGKYKDLRIMLDTAYADADRIAKDLKGRFSFERFSSLLFGPSRDESNFYALFESYVQKLQTEGRATTASSYNCALTSFKRFRPSLNLAEITPDLLSEYEKWMTTSGNSKTTTGIYTRSLRTVLNLAVDKGLIKQSDYPFGKNKYSPPTGRNVKKALTLSDVQLIYDYDAIEESPESKARDLWLFSYLCAGMNFKDIARLTFRNIHKDRIVFLRAKTERSHRAQPQPITIVLTDETRDIIKRWGNKSRMPDDYVFPVLRSGMTPLQEMNTIHQFIKTSNKYLSRIGQAIGLENQLTTYVARHTYATVLKRSGAPIEFISESLGHSSLKTTENYLDSFEDAAKAQYNEQLLAFKKKVV
jgi:integrase